MEEEHTARIISARFKYQLVEMFSQLYDLFDNTINIHFSREGIQWLSVL